MIEEVDERPDPALDDERRRYYRMTGLGRKVTLAEIQRLSHAIDVAKAKPLLGAALHMQVAGNEEAR